MKITILNIIQIFTIAAIIYFYIEKEKALKKASRTVEKNLVASLENERVLNQLNERKESLKQLGKTIDSQKMALDSIVQAAESMKNEAESQVKEYYETKKKELDDEFSRYEQDISNQMKQILAQKEEEKNKLQEIIDKQLAYIKAQQRQEEINNQKDYYRLVISEDDKSDIKILRDIQKLLVRKEGIDKIIYEVYYRPAYNTLMSHLFDTTDKVSGIYRLTDLRTGQSYIGQGVDLRERFKQHIKTSLAFSGATNKLYKAMQESGQFNFTFEILEEVPKASLNEREAYWINLYKTKEFGLNSTKGNTGS